MNVDLCKVGATRLTPGCGVAHTSRKGSTPGNVEGYTCRLTENTPQDAPWCRRTPTHTTPQLWAWSTPALSCVHWHGGGGDTAWGCTLSALITPPRPQACELPLTLFKSKLVPEPHLAVFQSCPWWQSSHLPGFPPAPSLQLLETAATSSHMENWLRQRPLLAFLSLQTDKLQLASLLQMCHSSGWKCC